VSPTQTNGVPSACTRKWPSWDAASLPCAQGGRGPDGAGAAAGVLVAAAGAGDSRGGGGLPADTQADTRIMAPASMLVRRKKRGAARMVSTVARDSEIAHSA
jgi:hypothetical protein